MPCDIVSVGSTPGMTSSPYARRRHRGPAGHLRLLRREPGSAGQRDVRPVRPHRPRSRGVPPGDGHAILDAGLKAMSSDSISAEVGAGVVCDLDAVPLPDVTFPTANEEHGFLAGPGVNRLSVGDLVRVIRTTRAAPPTCGAASTPCHPTAWRSGRSWPATDLASFRGRDATNPPVIAGVGVVSWPRGHVPAPPPHQARQPSRKSRTLAAGISHGRSSAPPLSRNTLALTTSGSAQLLGEDADAAAVGMRRPAEPVAVTRIRHRRPALRHPVEQVLERRPVRVRRPAGASAGRA